jgi:hypothetical protein
MEPDERELKKGGRNPINNPLSFLKALMCTMMDAHDNYHKSKSKGDYDRTIGIPAVINLSGIEKEIKTTDFDITQKESQALYNRGEESARRFKVISGTRHWGSRLACSDQANSLR